jgi:methylated-DNA-[protein]-cysteine S-methyltransferase
MPATLTRPRPTEMVNDPRSVVFETALGWMALTFDAQRLQRIGFGYAMLSDLIQSPGFTRLNPVDEPPQWIDRLRDRLAAFADGRPQQFADVPFGTEHLTPFAKCVVGECCKLEWGHVLTYAELAKKAGRPGAARAVGNVMANNRFPIVVPCHRVIGSGGGLGGYSAPGGLVTKRRLLEAEGVF